MSSKLYKLPGEPITIYHASENADLDNLAEVTQMHFDILNSQTEPTIHIADMSAAKLDMEGLSRLAANAALSENSPFHHPMFKEAIIVTQDAAITLGAQGLTSDTYGSVSLKVFGTLDEALAYARSER